MEEPTVMPEPEAPLMVEPVKKGQPLLAWIIIVPIIGYLAYLANRPAPAEQRETEDQFSLSILRTLGQAYVVLAEIQKSPNTDTLEKLKAELNPKTVEQRLRYSVLAEELAGPDEALKELGELDRKRAADQVELTLVQSRTRRSLGRLFQDYAAGHWDGPSLAESDREFLKDQLNWFGDLALAPRKGPDQSARNEVISSAIWRIVPLSIVGIILFLSGLVGLALLVVFLALMVRRRLQHLSFVSFHGGVYAETFAVWLIVFLGLNTAAHQLVREQDKILGSGAVSLLSLVALYWPKLRGIGWKQVREDIGWTAGRRGPLEPVIGVGAYMLTLPLAGIGLFITLRLVRLLSGLEDGAGGDFKPGSYPMHPAVPILAESDWWERLQILVLGCVVAPIVEETIFRGVLYRHLREGSRRLGVLSSVFFSALMVSFLFAVIHPQGLFAVPALMGLAFGFALIREWRGTLIPSMIAHGINNGLLFGLAILLFGN
jgi:membrane protease YdiL (CAAX protease family)